MRGNILGEVDVRPYPSGARARREAERISRVIPRRPDPEAQPLKATKSDCAGRDVLRIQAVRAEGGIPDTHAEALEAKGGWLCGHP